jgi:endonuclease/exonuclease/phosphatase family metal-dependent hydrolase
MFNLLTYNIHKGFSRYNRGFVLHEIREQLRSVSVDIVFLQEIHGRHHRHELRIPDWPEGSQFEFLAHELWPHYTYGKNAIYTQGHHGNAILSKHRFEQWNNVNVSRLRWASRSLLHGIIRVPEIEKPIHLICVHFEVLGFERKRQINILEKYVDESIDPTEPLIIAGDFNDWREKSALGLETRLGMEEVFKLSAGKSARTFPSNRPLLRMDRIYFRGLKLLDSDCLNGYPWRRMSDHLPLYAQFTAQ